MVGFDSNPLTNMRGTNGWLEGYYVPRLSDEGLSIIEVCINEHS